MVKLPNENLNSHLIDRSLKNKLDKITSTDVEKVACGSLNTVVLTNGGEVYVIGSNIYGQLGRPQKKTEKKSEGLDE